MPGQAGRALRSNYEGEVEAAVGVGILRVEGPIESSTRTVCARRITKGRSHVEVGRQRSRAYGKGEVEK
jgi:hypothetical protein